MTTLQPLAIAIRPDFGLWLTTLSERGVAALAAFTDGAAEAASASDRVVGLDVHDAALARGGDEHAFERIVRRHQQDIARRLRRFTTDPRVLEELVQETFVQAFFGLASYKGRVPLIHWLHRIAVRVGYRHWKEKKSNPTGASLNADAMPAPRTREPLELEAVLERLAPRDRLVLTLLYLEGRSVEDTAELAGWSRTMVKVQAFRARRRLRTLMQDEEAES